MSEYLKEAQWIADLTVSKLSDENSLLPRRIDCKSGEVIDPERMIDDLGDYVQNIWYLGKILGNQGLMDFALTSACNAARFYQDESGLFKGAFRQGILGKIDWYSNEDVFVGLTALYRLSKNRQIEDIIIRFQQGIERYARDSGVLPAAGKGILKYIGIPPKAFVEGLVQVYLANGSENTLDLARILTVPWINLRFFKQHGIFPSRILTLSWLNDKMQSRINFMGKCIIPKTNINFLHGILELYKATGDKIYADSMKHWINSAEKNLFKDGLYVFSYNANNRAWSYHDKSLIPSIAVLSFYADFCKYLGDKKVLSILELRAKNLLQSQTEIGFFRDAPYDPKDPKYSRGFFDCQTDMAVLLLKLYCLMNDKRYLEASKRCVDSVIKYLKCSHGYLDYFNASNGNAEYHSRMYTKFFTLFIKALILLDAALSGEDLYQEELLILSADR